MSLIGKVGTLIGLILSLIIFYVPVIHLAVKRAHDLNMSGLWVLTVLVPFLNIYTLIMFGFSTGDNESNQYGDTPLKHIPANNVAYWAAAIAMYVALVVIKLVGMLGMFMQSDADTSMFANMEQHMMNRTSSYDESGEDATGE